MEWVIAAIGKAAMGRIIIQLLNLVPSVVSGNSIPLHLQHIFDHGAMGVTTVNVCLMVSVVVFATAQTPEIT